MKTPTLTQRLERAAAWGPLSISIPHVEPVAARIDPRTERAIAAKPGEIAMISVRGVIVPRENALSNFFGEVGSEDIARRVRAAMSDRKVKAIVLDVDTPGGSAFGVAEAVEEIKASRGAKPIIAHADYVMASAGYHLATAADEIVASPSAEIGNVGVLALHRDISEALSGAGIKITAIEQPVGKSDGWPFFPLSDSYREEVQASVDATYEVFAGHVADARGVDRGVIARDFVKMHVAKSAKEIGMIDKIRTMSETIGAYTQSAGAPVALRQALLSHRRKYGAYSQ
jgi:signal peptide peptidase SppA